MNTETEPQIAADNPFVVPLLRTQRLLVRELEPSDLDACVALYADIGWNDPALSAEQDRVERSAWLRWTMDGYRQFARLYQPPLGERAIADADTGAFLGLVGYVPSFEPFERLTGLGERPAAGRSMELGLFWALSPSAQGRGYAAEAASALIGHAFRAMAADRIIATTSHDNLASIAVMRRLGMTIETYTGEHPGLQVVGMLKAT